MSADKLPLILEPEQLSDNHQREDLLIVDLCAYSDGHIPGAVTLAYSDIIAGEPPVMGLVPGAEALGSVMSRIGLSEDSCVVAYDNEGNGKAARFLYTLDCLGHKQASLLNGGLDAWINAGLELDDDPREPEQTDYVATLTDTPVADKAYIESMIGSEDVVLLDTRSPDEFHGKNLRAKRGGHIPGAINIEWTELMNADAERRIRPASHINALLQRHGISTDKEVIVYCQTHHRSAHSYVVLKSLGFEKLKGYPGAWSEWGNLEDTPIER